MLSSKKQVFPKAVILASTLAFCSGVSADTSIDTIADKISQIPENSEYVSDSEYKVLMEGLAKQEALAKRKAKVQEALEKIATGKEGDERKEVVEKTMEEKLNPPKDAKEVSIEFYDLMEKEYQQNLFDMRQEIDRLKERIISLKDPSNPEVAQNHIYVTEIYSFGENRYAKVFHDFHFNDMTEGEEIIDGIKILSIDDRGIVVKKATDGSTHRIYKTTKTRAIENAYAKKQDPEMRYLLMRNQARSPSDIDITPERSMGEVVYPDMGGSMPPFIGPGGM